MPTFQNQPILELKIHFAQRAKNPTHVRLPELESAACAATFLLIRLGPRAETPPVLARPNSNKSPGFKPVSQAFPSK
jgi:hypothetical protein